MTKLVEMLRRHEGVKMFAYKDHLGYTTVGCGRCVEEGVGLGLSYEEINYLLKNDINRVRQELKKEYRWFSDLNEDRQDAMIDISFNLGATRLRKFRRAISAMEVRDYDKAAYEFLNSRWKDQVGDRAKELANIIRTGEY